MTHIGLFEGIGGFSLGARKVGWATKAWCEINPFGQKILKQTFPNATGHADITTTDFTIYRNAIDVLTGGWPCQDNSKAKQHGSGQKGLQGERSGLFYEFERAIREIRPRFIVGENVPDLLTVNGGRDFNYILSSLARMGYDATWGVLRASDIGAPHHRARFYLVAYPHGLRFPPLRSIWANVGAQIEKGSWLLNGTAIQVGGEWRETAPNIIRMDDDVPDRAHRIKALGNAIVPEIAYQIFQAIEQYQSTTMKT